MHYSTKNMIVDALCHIDAFVYNILHLASVPPERVEFASLRNFVLSMPLEEQERYKDECDFLRTMPLDDMVSVLFPYRVCADFSESLERGQEKGLPWILHKGKRLFFPKHTSVGGAISSYEGLVLREGLLGNGVLQKSPHCYQNKDFEVGAGDILLDVGCAEAIFALDNIDKVSKAYLFECSPEWRKPLQRTFAPYKDKVVLVNKLVSDTTNRKSTTLVDVLKGDMEKGASFFVKMDIEGWERTVLLGNADFFKSAKIKLSCCVYHRQDDARVIEAILRDMGYKTRFSDGYMLPTMNGIHYPYFRHGVIYAQNY